MTQVGWMGPVISTGPACRLHMTHLVGSGGHRGPRALLGHLAPAAHLRASPIGCAQPVTCDLFRHARKWQLATFLPTSCRLPSFPRMDVSSSGPHSFKLLGPLLLMPIPSYGSACTLLHSAGLLHAATSRTSSCSWPRRAIAGQTNRRRPARGQRTGAFGRLVDDLHRPS